MEPDGRTMRMTSGYPRRAQPHVPEHRRDRAYFAEGPPAAANPDGALSLRTGRPAGDQIGSYVPMAVYAMRWAMARATLGGLFPGDQRHPGLVGGYVWNGSDRIAV